MERLVIALVVALVLLQIVESTAGPDTATWFAFVLIMGIAVYQREGLIKFANDLQARLA